MILSCSLVHITNFLNLYRSTLLLIVLTAVKLPYMSCQILSAVNLLRVFISHNHFDAHKLLHPNAVFIHSLLLLSMSNTFDGIVGEFPFIGVDRFDLSASTFLLTHYHADHLVGLYNKSFTGLVYCSKETKELLKVHRTDSSSLELVNTLEYNVPTRVELPQNVESVYGDVYITLIRAYHCVGSCMFLVENCNGAVLITGDIRAEQWWCESLRNIPPLYPYINGIKSLDNIYFDSTFGYRGEPYIEMPANNSGIHTAICLLKDYPKDDPEIEFVFQDTVLGFEQAWAFILSYFRASLKISDEKLKAVIRIATKYDCINGPALIQALKRGSMEKPAKGGIFHAYPKDAKQSDTGTIIIRIKQCINFNILDFAGVFCPLLLSSITLDEKQSMKLLRTTKQGNMLYQVRDRLWILPRNGTELLPLDIKLVFSRHSSNSETRQFISMFRPKQVFPCWFSRQAWLNGLSMQRLFGDCCSGDIFHFDSIMLSQCGLSLKDISERGVTTVDRWNVGDCKEEESFINDVVEENRRLKSKGLTENKIALINLRRVARVPLFKHDQSKDDQDSIQKSYKDFHLQKIVENRRDFPYRKFIESQQQRYYKRHNLPQYERDYEAEKYLRQFRSTLGGSSDCDTDSCSSSIDLAELATRHISPVQEASQVSVITEPLDSLTWKFPSHCKTPGKGLLSSFEKSYVDSFEESTSNKRAKLCRPPSLESINFYPGKLRSVEN